MSLFTLTAKTSEGLEQVLSDELEALGAHEIKILNRAVQFKGNQKLLYKANYLCRTALHILKPIAEFDIIEQEDLYDEIAKIAWEKMFSVDCFIAVNVQCFDSVYTHSKFASQKIKDAVVDRFRKLFNQRPSVDIQNPDICIDLFMKNNHCILSMDSSGRSLHRRGYRLADNGAPLNEVLAAGLLALTGWDGKRNLCDPMCGSGTLLIEAAMKASNQPAGFYRQAYSFQHWNDFDANLWREIKEDALKEMHDPICEIIGGDIDEESLSIAEHNIKSAKLHQDIELYLGDFFEMESPFDDGILICNPPYGERMELEDPIAFYQKMADTLKKNYPGFQAWIISSDWESMKHLGLKTSKRINIKNGPLECKFICIDLYQGSINKAQELFEEE